MIQIGIQIKRAKDIKTQLMERESPVEPWRSENSSMTPSFPSLVYILNAYLFVVCAVCMVCVDNYSIVQVWKSEGRDVAALLPLLRGSQELNSAHLHSKHLYLLGHLALFLITVLLLLLSLVLFGLTMILGFCLFVCDMVSYSPG